MAFFKNQRAFNRILGKIVKGKKEKGIEEHAFGVGAAA